MPGHNGLPSRSEHGKCEPTENMKNEPVFGSEKQGRGHCRMRMHQRSSAPSISYSYSSRLLSINTKERALNLVSHNRSWLTFYSPYSFASQPFDGFAN